MDNSPFSVNVQSCDVWYDVPRNTPYSSIEAAVEVSRALSHQQFGTREPLQPILLSQVILITVVLLIVLVLVYRNRNQ